MKRFTLASLATAAFMAIATVGSAMPAQAAGSVELRIGRDGGEIRVDPAGHRNGWHDDRRGGRGGHDGWRDDRRHGGGHGWRDDRRHGRGFCSPGEAIQKARAMGLRRPDISSVGRGQVVVTGRHRGHWAWVAFDRDSRHCRVLGSRGI